MKSVVKAMLGACNSKERLTENRKKKHEEEYRERRKKEFEVELSAKGFPYSFHPLSTRFVIDSLFNMIIDLELKLNQAPEPGEYDDEYEI